MGGANMRGRFENIFVRKLLTSIISTAILSLALALIYANDSEPAYNRGNDLMGWSMVYMMYIGAVILVFGNAVSFSLEYVQSKWKRQHHWLYILLHGLFGSANTLFFGGLGFGYVYLGIIAALVYAIIDRGIYYRFSKQKGVTLYILIPVLVYLLAWGYFQFTSPPMPPFTDKDAIAFATEGEGTIESKFPDEIGTWQGTIAGYDVVRETSVTKRGNEKYLVKFTETWGKGTESGSWFHSYEVDRNSLTMQDGGGEMPPFYE